jgi:hypothetical protein
LISRPRKVNSRRAEVLPLIGSKFAKTIDEQIGLTRWSVRPSRRGCEANLLLRLSLMLSC